jgi:amidase
VYIRTAERGDTLVVNILDIELADRGVIVVIPGSGVLGDKQFKSKARMVDIRNGFAEFNNARIKLQPVVGTLGVAPYGEPVQCSVPYKHGGNLDCAEIGKGTRLYLPVAAGGALFAAGDLHAVQEDGELCVSSVEMAGRILFKFDIMKGKQAEWPILETRDHFSVLTADESLDKAVRMAAEKAVEAIMRAKGWSFEDAYMFSSLAVKAAINQVVDPKRGARAQISKEDVTIDDLLA